MPENPLKYAAGVATAYGAYLRGGGTLSYDDWCALLARLTGIQQEIAEAVDEFTGTTVPGAVQEVEQTGAAQVQAVETAGATQPGNVNTAGATQLAAVNQAGAAQLAAVNTAGSEQVQAVEDKGAEVLESIPEDYSDLSADVVDLKSSVNRDLFASAFEPLGREYYAENVFSSGYISATGAEGNNSANARSVYFPTATVRAVSIPLGYKLKFVWFSTASASGILGLDEGYQQCGPNILNYVDAPENAQFFRMQLRNNDITTITSADLAELSSSIVLYASGGAAAWDRALKKVVDLNYNRQLAGRLSTSTFELIKSSMISGSSGGATSDARYARTAIFTMRLDSFRFTCPDGFAANVSFYNALLVQGSEFIEKQTLRYEGSSYLVFPPASTVGAVVEFHRKDWAVLTDDDVAAIAAGFRVYAAGSAEIPAIPEAEARAAFVAYMNETCSYLGLGNSEFVNASGLNRSNSSCPLDELKLAIAVAGNPLACDLWSTKDRDFYIGGANPRTISVVNNVYGADREGNVTYKLLGGKGGSLSASSESYYRKARLGLYDVNGTPVAVALMGPGQWIYNNMPACTHELLAMMADKLEGNTPTEGEYLTQLIAKGGGYAAVPVPNAVQAYRNSYAASELLTIANALHNNDSASQTPASTTKTVTMLCALRVASDLQEVITINSTEANVGGSGSTYSSGDKVTLEEALRIMMMESSNTMAEAIGRVIGTKLLLTRSAKG